MKIKIFIFSILIFVGMVLPAEAKKYTLFVGSNKEGDAKGILVFRFNDQTGRLTDMLRPVKSANPSFIAISPNKKFLYAVNDTTNLDSLKSGSVSSFKIESDNRLIRINQVLSHGSNPRYLCVSPDGKWLVVSNYTSGSLSFFSIQPNGSISEMVQLIQHEGRDSRAQAVQFDSAGKLLFSADLATNEITIYNIPAGDKLFVPHATPVVNLAGGSGPRSLQFSSDGRFIYVVNEMNSTVSVLMKYGAEWKIVQNVRTVPKDFKEENKCADIQIAADGRFAYVTNRGHNTIAIFKRDATNGKLELIDNMPSEGQWPLSLALDPSDRYLLVANQKSNNITVFRIDPPSGKLRYTGFNVPAESPACIKFQK